MRLASWRWERAWRSAARSLQCDGCSPSRRGRELAQEISWRDSRHWRTGEVGNIACNNEGRGRFPGDDGDYSVLEISERKRPGFPPPCCIQVTHLEMVQNPIQRGLCILLRSKLANEVVERCQCMGRANATKTP